jgi:hypothetical protein
MVYMAADNNLEGFGIADFAELASIGSSAQVNIVVQFDRIANYSTAAGDWTGARRYHITRAVGQDHLPRAALRAGVVGSWQRVAHSSCGSGP